MHPTKPLDHYRSIGLTFIEATGILSLLNNNVRTLEARRQDDLDEMCIAVGLTFEAIQNEIMSIRKEQISTAQLEASKAQTQWMLDMTNDEWIQALQRLDINSPLGFDMWMQDERSRHET